MATFKLFLLPGDGIGPEVMAEAEKVIRHFDAEGRRALRNREGPGRRLAPMTRTASRSARTTWSAPPQPTPFCSAPSAARNGTAFPTRFAPRRACCGCARTSELYANLRPAICYPALADASSLKREVVEGLDIMIVRELTGGVYFGEPKQIIDLGNGQKRGDRHAGLRHATKSSASAASPSTWRGSGAIR